MSGQRGVTLVELVIATAVMLVVTASVMTLLRDGLAATPLLAEAADLHQRARVAADALAADLRAAGSGTPSGPLPLLLPAVEPRVPGAPAGTASANVLTVRYVPPRAARSRLAAPLEPGEGTVTIETAGCPDQTTACGFTAGMAVAVFDGAGQMDHFRLEAIDPGILVIAAPADARPVGYAAGSEIAETVEATYAVDGATRQLRRIEGGGAFALADHVESLSFEYLGEALVRLPLSIFEDGPFRAMGRRMFDVDLLTVQAVAATVRLASGSARVPAATARITVALRNGR